MSNAVSVAESAGDEIGSTRMRVLQEIATNALTSLCRDEIGSTRMRVLQEEVERD